MRKLLVIGIGAGDPEQITVQAIKALNRAKVFFVLDKGDAKRNLLAIRRDICARYIEGDDYRFVELTDAVRDPQPAGYRAGVDAWHRARAAILARAIADELPEDGCGAFLVWGDPSLYDSTLRILDLMQADGGLAFECEVIPGITSVQALAARHRIALNHIGGAVRIAPGRLLRETPALDDDNVVVMLDSGGAFTAVDPTDTTIYWGAYLGTDKEMLVAGPLAEKSAEIERLRAAAQARHGWIMDIYLLRRGET